MSVGGLSVRFVTFSGASAIEGVDLSALYSFAGHRDEVESRIRASITKLGIVAECAARFISAANHTILASRVSRLSIGDAIVVPECVVE